MKRRTFASTCLKAGVAVGAAPLILNGCTSNPNRQITLGMIGTGSHGVGWNMKAFLNMPDVRIVAVCDVDQERREQARQTVNETYGDKDCTAHNDFRELLAREDIDAVMVSTPDHWHVPIAIMAAQAGKHICCEKPTLTIDEGRVLCDVIRKEQRIFQTSIEDRCIPVYHRMAQLVRNGYIGELKTIRIRLPDKTLLKMREASAEIQPVPPGFDYDMWLGPAPEAPYAPGRCHFNFRWILDYSGGMLTDWGAHYVDTAQWANNSENSGPVEVDGKGRFLDHPLYNTADDFSIDYRYANGVHMHIESGGNAIAFEGTEGWIQCMGWRGDLTASNGAILNEKMGWFDKKLRTAESEHRDFIDCIKKGRQTMIPPETGHRTASILHMGNISMLLDRKLTWDPVREVFADDEAANAMKSRERRAPWRLEDIVKT